MIAFSRVTTKRECEVRFVIWTIYCAFTWNRLYFLMLAFLPMNGFFLIPFSSFPLHISYSLIILYVVRFSSYCKRSSENIWSVHYFQWDIIPLQIFGNALYILTNQIRDFFTLNIKEITTLSCFKPIHWTCLKYVH